MKWLFILTLLSVSVNASAASGRHRERVGASKTIGVGIMFGEPTGLTGKRWLDEDRAVDLGLAFSLSSFFLIQGDYLWHFHGAFGEGTRFLDRLEPYLGVGAVIFFNTDSGRRDGRFYTNSGSGAGLGIRIPFGTEWLLTDLPVGVFAELVPGLGLAPSTFGFFQGVIGGRFYF